MKGPQLVATLNLTLTGFKSPEQLKDLFQAVQHIVEESGMELVDVGGGIGLAIPKSDMEDLASTMLHKEGMSEDELRDVLLPPDDSKRDDDGDDENGLKLDFDPRKYRN